MPTLKQIGFISFLLISSFSYCATVDLGNLEIEGEIRRPMLNLIEPQSKINKVIDDLNLKKLNELENIILEYDEHFLESLKAKES